MDRPGGATTASSDLAIGLERVISEGAPAQSRRAAELLTDLQEGQPGSAEAATDLIRAFLHDPDLWR